MKKFFLLLFFASLVFSATIKISNDFILTPANPIWSEHGLSIKLTLIKNGVAYLTTPQYPDLKSVSEGTTFGPFTVLDLTSTYIKLRYENVPKDLKSVITRASEKWAVDQNLPVKNVVTANLGKRGKSIIYVAFYRQKIPLTFLGLTLTFHKCIGKSFLVTPSSDSFIAARLSEGYICM